LYVKDPWLDRRSGYRFITDIHDKLIEWTSYVVRRFEETPFGYTEWTLSGHLAMAADRAKFFALQDYFAVSSDAQGRAMPRNRQRPDLYIRRPNGSDECVFEIKSRNVGLEQRRFSGRIQSALSEAWNKVIGYAQGEATYCCALVGLPVYAHVKNWSEECGTWRRYRRSCDELFSALETGVKRSRSRDANAPTQPNFYWGYFLRFRYATREKKGAEQHEYDPVAIGMLWVGRVAQSPK
jgi:hypothetical protein